MIAFKGFNKDLTCTRGNGQYRYEVGKKYTEDKATCAAAGFHCVEEPIEVLRWYSNGRYCIVEAGGDIHEDGQNRISCTEITILREINIIELAFLECKWLQKHPKRQYSNLVHKEEGSAVTEDIVIVRGKHPRAAGRKGSTLFLLKEAQRGSSIEYIEVIQIDGETYQPNVFYQIDGRVCET